MSASRYRLLQTPKVSDNHQFATDTAREVLSKTNHVGNLTAKPVLRQNIPYLVQDAVPAVCSPERQAAA